MSFEWDEDKNRTNIEDHGIRFEDDLKIFDGPVLTEVDERYDYDEIREISLGLFKGIDQGFKSSQQYTGRVGIPRFSKARVTLSSRNK